ncbi:hypothetical protein T265_00900 [Opisthorchis viverrini]|uniref:Uncharacterized protein n=1 Tax=Opisthorchis viverrini TaxID=6198 RepID=A0A075A4M9_OPIVI|nr:hypothetical protein T265_00900 [Opisthorchis viverrini]KER33212.1 hypothetical protein T265_00900 [Opisthorchis viverrini]
MRHEGWDIVRSPKPRQGESRGRGRVRTTDLPAHIPDKHPWTMFHLRNKKYDELSRKSGNCEILLDVNASSEDPKQMTCVLKV